MLIQSYKFSLILTWHHENAAKAVAAALALGGSLLFRDIIYKADRIETVLIPYKMISK